MKILSRPPVIQPCEQIIINSLKQLYHMNYSLGLIPPSLDQYCGAVVQIMTTAEFCGVLKSFEVGPPEETNVSTFENEEWILPIRFSGDGTNFYNAELTFNFRRAK